MRRRVFIAGLGAVLAWPLEAGAQQLAMQALDDELHEAARVQVFNPNAYRPGTFARLADAYDAAGD